MNPTRKYAAVLVAASAITAAAAFFAKAQLQSPAQAQTTPAMNRNLVVLDPAHGGADGGILLGDHIYEKDVTLELATKLRATLTSAGFTVVSTHDSDSFDPLTTDQRAEIANRTRAVACIVIHASNSGSGVHLYTSALQPPQQATYSYWPGAQQTFAPTPWESAQAAFVSLSQRMASNLSSALGAAHLPSLVGHEPVRPLDNLLCPAIAIELAPLSTAGSDATQVNDPNYQQRVATTVAASLLAWRNQEIPASTSTPIKDAPTKDSTQTSNPSTQPSTTATTPAKAAASSAKAAALTRAAAKATAAAESAGQTAARYHTSVGVRAGGQSPAPSSGLGQVVGRSPSRTNAPSSSTNSAAHTTTGAHAATGAHSSSSPRATTGSHSTPPEVE